MSDRHRRTITETNRRSVSVNVCLLITNGNDVEEVSRQILFVLDEAVSSDMLSMEHQARGAPHIPLRVHLKECLVDYHFSSWLSRRLIVWRAEFDLQITCDFFPEKVTHEAIRVQLLKAYFNVSSVLDKSAIVDKRQYHSIGNRVDESILHKLLFCTFDIMELYK